ncbi:hypothetical protein BH11PLA1_BH11PLA1_05890 [soil metagenome]
MLHTFTRSFRRLLFDTCVLSAFVIVAASVWTVDILVEVATDHIHSHTDKYCLTGLLFPGYGYRTSGGHRFDYVHVDGRWRQVACQKFVDDGTPVPSDAVWVSIWQRSHEAVYGIVTPCVRGWRAAPCVTGYEDVAHVLPGADLEQETAELLRRYAIDALHDETIAPLLKTGGSRDRFEVLPWGIVNDTALLLLLAAAVAEVRMKPVRKRFNRVTRASRLEGRDFGTLKSAAR